MHFTFDLPRTSPVADTIRVRFDDGSLRRLVLAPTGHAFTPLAYPLLRDGWPAQLTRPTPPRRSQITETFNVSHQEAAAALCLRRARSYRYPQP